MRRIRVGLLMAIVVMLPACTQADPDPEPDASVPLPLSSPTGMQAVAVFLHSGNSEDCAEVVPVEREVPNRTLESAMTELLAGPTDAEAGQGLGGWFSEATAGMLNSAEIDERVARADFGDLRSVIPNASTSCGSATLLAQLDQTARQFEVDQTLYSIDGSPEAFYEWLQRSVPER